MSDPAVSPTPAITYGVDYRGAKLLYPWGGEDLRWVERLELMEGTEEDARSAIRIFDQIGQTGRADSLRQMLPPGPRLALLDTAPPYDAAQVRMRRASAALDEAMARCDGKSVNDAEATGLLVCAVAEHSRALAGLFAAHLEGGR